MRIEGEKTPQEDPLSHARRQILEAYRAVAQTFGLLTPEELLSKILEDGHFLRFWGATSAHREMILGLSLPIYKYGGWSYDPEIKEVTKPDQSTVILSKVEGALFHPLIANPTKRIPYSVLLRCINPDSDITDDLAYLRSSVSHLRRKLGDGNSRDKQQHSIIIGHTNIGYSFSPPISDNSTQTT